MGHNVHVTAVTEVKFTILVHWLGDRHLKSARSALYNEMNKINLTYASAFT